MSDLQEMPSDAEDVLEDSVKKKLPLTQKSYSRDGVLHGIDDGSLEKVAADKRSPVWEHFMLVRDAESQTIIPYVICKACQEVFKHVTKNGSSHLSHHVKETCRPAPKNQPKITAFCKPQKTLQATIPNVAKCVMIDSCVRYVAEDMRSFESVSGNGFERLIQAAIDIGAEYGKISAKELLPHPVTVSRHVESEAKKGRSDLFPIIADSLRTNGGALAFDFWTDPYNHVQYMGITVQYFVNWELKESVVFVSPYDPAVKKTAVNVRKYLTAKLVDLGLKESECSNIFFVTDAGSNMIAALKLANYPKLSRISCAAHLLNRVSKNALEKLPENHQMLPDIIQKCKALVRHIKATTLQHMQPRMVKQEVETRWHTVIDMVDSLLSVYDDIQVLLLERKEDELLPEPKEFLEGLVNLLRPLKTATEELSATATPTLHLVLPWRRKFELLFVNDPTDAGTEFGSISALRRLLFQFVQQKFVVLSVHQIATFLNPRMRTLKMLNEVEKRNVYALVRDWMPVTEATNSVATAVPAKRKLSTMFAEFEDEIQPMNENDEIENYQKIQLHADSLKSENFLLEFWKENESDLPRLSKLAKRILSVPATSTGCERTFSLAGFVTDNRRNRLKPEKVDNLLFLKKYYADKQ